MMLLTTFGKFSLSTIPCQFPDLQISHCFHQEKRGSCLITLVVSPVCLTLAVFFSMCNWSYSWCALEALHWNFWWSLVIFHGKIRMENIQFNGWSTFLFLILLMTRRIVSRFVGGLNTTYVGWPSCLKMFSYLLTRSYFWKAKTGSFSTN